MKKVFYFVEILIIIISESASAQETDNSFSKPSKAEVFCHSFMSRTIMRPFYNTYFNQIHLKGDETVLDFGCGWGTEALILAKRLNKDGRLACLDISPEWIAESKEVLKDFKNIDYYLGDITSLKIPDNSFDIIVIHFVLHDIDTAFRPGIILALSKITKPGGQLYIREPLLVDRQISANGIESLMNRAGLQKKIVKFSNSLIFGNLVEMIFEKNK